MILYYKPYKLVNVYLKTFINVYFLSYKYEQKSYKKSIILSFFMKIKKNINSVLIININNLRIKIETRC
jgi:hypothetical protein